MQPTIAIAVTTGVVLLAAVLGLVWRARTGRVRRVDGEWSFRAGTLPGLHELAALLQARVPSPQWSV